MTANGKPKITICIPHWQVKQYLTLCLRSINKHSQKYDLQVIVVDNGSKDESLDYLRSLDWILLLERPEEVHTNWPRNVFTAWDYGMQHATGDYFITMHSDVFVKSDDWLDPMLREINHSYLAAATGAWKLHLENPIYAFQKRVTAYARNRIKKMLGIRKYAEWAIGQYPRDYCAMYRRDIILNKGLQFLPLQGKEGGLSRGGGYSIAMQLWNAGYTTQMISVHEMRSKIVHIAHGTAAVREEKPLRYKRKQKKLEVRTACVLKENWLKELQADAALDKQL
ncbi:MAG: glycosyltransferase family 2 protein [Thermodesulfobacteriota bacterium]|nr:glycosyltransferase family 2 protein [Thermodesulfobacteriota bacterium]